MPQSACNWSCFFFTAMLSLVLKDVVNVRNLLDGRGKDVETGIRDTNTINIKILDKNININRIKKYFVNNTWFVLKKRVAEKKDLAERLWQRSDIDVHVYSAIVCYGCLEWHYLKCLGLKAPPKTTYWLCRKCNKTT